MRTAEEVRLKRLEYLSRWHDLGNEFIHQKDLILRKMRALAYFMLARNHSHCWFRIAEVVTVEGLGTRLQFSRWCYCGRRQTLIEWWNQFKEPCYHG